MGLRVVLAGAAGCALAGGCALASLDGLQGDASADSATSTTASGATSVSSGTSSSVSQGAGGAPCSDPAQGGDCGGCNRDCLGGPCQAGRCLPLEIVSGEDDIVALALTGDVLYWTTDTRLRRRKIDGGPVETLATGTGLGHVLVGGDALYWSDRAAGRIFRSDLDAEVVEQLIARYGNPNGLALRNADLYFSDSDGGSIHRYDGQFIWPTASDLDTPVGLLVAYDVLYWAESGANWIGGMELGVGKQPVTSVADAPEALASDQTHLYWTSRASGEVARIAFTGSQSELVVDGLQSPRGIAVDADAIYVTAGGSIQRVAK